MLGNKVSGNQAILQEMFLFLTSTNRRRFPGQEHNAGSSKIPTVLYYDKCSKVRAVGAETELDHIVEQAEDEEWLKVQWYLFILSYHCLDMS
jgi:hypothetical protein